MGQRTIELRGSGRVPFCWSRGVGLIFWMNPMRPSFDDFSTPLPRPNHPKGTLVGWLGRGSGEVWGQTRMNPMRPWFVDKATPFAPANFVERLSRIEGVIPAQAGIHTPLLMAVAWVVMGPCFRRGDKREMRRGVANSAEFGSPSGRLRGMTTMYRWQPWNKLPWHDDGKLGASPTHLRHCRASTACPVMTTNGAQPLQFRQTALDRHTQSAKVSP